MHTDSAYVLHAGTPTPPAAPASPAEPEDPPGASAKLDLLVSMKQRTRAMVMYASRSRSGSGSGIRHHQALEASTSPAAVATAAAADTAGSISCSAVGIMRGRQSQSLDLDCKCSALGAPRALRRPPQVLAQRSLTCEGQQQLMLMQRQRQRRGTEGDGGIVQQQWQQQMGAAAWGTEGHECITLHQQQREAAEGMEGDGGMEWRQQQQQQQQQQQREAAEGMLALCSLGSVDSDSSAGGLPLCIPDSLPGGAVVAADDLTPAAEGGGSFLLAAGGGDGGVPPGAVPPDVLQRDQRSVQDSGNSGGRCGPAGSATSLGGCGSSGVGGAPPAHCASRSGSRPGSATGPGSSLGSAGSLGGGGGTPFSHCVTLSEASWVLGVIPDNDDDDGGDGGAGSNDRLLFHTSPHTPLPLKSLPATSPAAASLEASAHASASGSRSGSASRSIGSGSVSRSTYASPADRSQQEEIFLRSGAPSPPDVAIARGGPPHPADPRRLSLACWGEPATAAAAFGGSGAAACWGDVASAAAAMETHHRQSRSQSQHMTQFEVLQSSGIEEGCDLATTWHEVTASPFTDPEDGRLGSTVRPGGAVQCAVHGGAVRYGRAEERYSLLLLAPFKNTMSSPSRFVFLPCHFLGLLPPPWPCSSLRLAILITQTDVSARVDAENTLAGLLEGQVRSTSVDCAAVREHTQFGRALRVCTDQWVQKRED